MKQSKGRGSEILAHCLHRPRRMSERFRGLELGARRFLGGGSPVGHQCSGFEGGQLENRAWV